jgi:hypothetical protein
MVRSAGRTIRRWQKLLVPDLGALTFELDAREALHQFLESTALRRMVFTGPQLQPCESIPRAPGPSHTC